MTNPDIFFEDYFHRIEIKGGMFHSQTEFLNEGAICISSDRHVDIEIYEHYGSSLILIDELHFEQDVTNNSLYEVKSFVHVGVYEFTFPDGFKVYMHSREELCPWPQQYPLPIYDGT